MRFLADESCDFAVVRALRAAGHEVSAVAEMARGAKDAEVMVEARPFDAEGLGQLARGELADGELVQDPEPQRVAERGGRLDEPPRRRFRVVVEGRVGNGAHDQER